MKIKTCFLQSNSDWNKEGELKLLGYEQKDVYLSRKIYEDCNVIFTAICFLKDENCQVIHKMQGARNVIQASINKRNNILVFTVKDEICAGSAGEQQHNHSAAVKYKYSFYCVSISQDCYINDLEIASENQIMAQFLYKKKDTNDKDKFIILTHQHSIVLYEISQQRTSISEDSAYTITLLNVLTKSFSWAQWDAEHQCLFYIHYREVQHTAIEEEEKKETLLKSQNQSHIPTLTSFQFHDDMPHETVLNLPLNLPQLTDKSSCMRLHYNYTDIPVPLRVFDSTMDVLILVRSTGVFCVCCYYIFQQTKVPISIRKDVIEANERGKTGEFIGNRVNFAYSVILLHHGSVINCTFNAIPLNVARKISPVFCLYKDQHLMVYADGIFVHLLDVGIMHEPCCHVLLPHSLVTKNNDRILSEKFLVPVPGKVSKLINVTSLEIVELSFCKEQLIETFTDEKTTVINKLSILHYLLVHSGENDVLCPVMTSIVENLSDVNVSRFLKEILVANCYSLLNRQLSLDAVPLLALMPLSTLMFNAKYESKMDNKYDVILEQELLSDPSVMLLTPRQRLIPFRSDIWIKLWDLLRDRNVNSYKLSRFKNSTVTEKLALSLTCYQPEALSRCTTPLSPGGPHIASTGMLADLANMSRTNKSSIDPLPFVEIEASAASKQEHVISVNLREISMHLVKHGQSPMQVHAISIRYVSAQLETTRLLCSSITKAASINTEYVDRGFPLVDRLEENHRRIFFSMLERYHLAVDCMSFPLPLGFPSFYAYLGYKTLPINKFLDYCHANAFQLNIDVMKSIMADLSDDKEELKVKLSLLSNLPRSRAKRLLNQWTHPVSLMIRAREHSLNILSGISNVPHRSSNLPRAIRHVTSGKGVAAFPSKERLSPLDTFLELLTAKANLTEIDFNLLIEATATSTKEFI